MAKIISSASGPIPPDPNQPRAVDGRKEPVITPEPKTKAQRQANAKARRIQAAYERQLSQAPRNDKSRKKAQRRRSRKLHKRVVEDGLKKQTISPEQAQKMLPPRQKRTTSE
jgi:hypothetical protein